MNPLDPEEIHSLRDYYDRGGTDNLLVTWLLVDGWRLYDIDLHKPKRIAFRDDDKYFIVWLMRIDAQCTPDDFRFYYSLQGARQDMALRGVLT